MHSDDSRWIDEHGDELYTAAQEISDGLKRHGIHAYITVKQGSVRDEAIGFWDGGLFTLLFGYGINIDTTLKMKVFQNTWNKFRRFVYFKIDRGHLEQRENESLHNWSKRYEKRIWKGLCHVNKKLGLTKRVNDWQAMKINRVFQEVCKRHPDIVDELVCFLTCYPCIKPCKYGSVDGEKIHEKYWRTL